MGYALLYRFLKFRKKHCERDGASVSVRTPGLRTALHIPPRGWPGFTAAGVRPATATGRTSNGAGAVTEKRPGGFSLFRLSPLFLFFLFLFLSPSGVRAGQEAANWYFGDSVAVRFSGGPVSVGVGAMSTSEGCAVWSDPLTGQLLLYTDGQTVWNGAGGVLDNGTGLMGHESSTQSALLIPQPGTTDRFFLFTAGVGPYEVPDNNGIRHSIVDLTQNAVQAKNTPLLEPATEKLVGIPHCNGQDYWAVAHEWGTNAFHAWKVTASGVASRAVVSSTGTIAPTTNDNYVIGFLKASPDGRRLVSTGYYSGAVQLFDFNSSTGAVSNPLTLPTDGSVYGASFSPDNTKLYIADQQLGTRSLIRMYQYTISDVPADILASRTVVAEFTGGFGDELGALQIASDGKIYCAREGGRWLAVINNPNASGAACDYVHDGLYLGGRRSLLGLPNFLDAGFNTGESCLPPEAMFLLDTTICAGMSIAVEDRSLHQPASWRWEFPGAAPPVFTGRHPRDIYYHVPGTYDVRLIAANSRGADTLVRRNAVVVLPGLGASAGADVGICPGGTAVLSGRGGATYRWEPAEGLDHPDSAVTSARPPTTTTYVLTVREGLCTDRDTVVVTVHPAPVAAGGMYTLCSGDSVRHNAAGSPGTYRWEPALGVSDPDTSAPLLFPEVTTEYTVTLTDANGCSTSAIVRVEVGAAAIDAGRDTSVCRGGSVVLRAQGLSGGYTWTPADGLDDPGSATPTATPLATTTYVVVATGGNCTATDSVTVVVRDLPRVDAGADIAICRGGEAVLRATGSTGVYRWEPADGVEHPNAASTVVRPTTTTTYRVFITDEYGCTASDEVTVSVEAALVVDAGNDAQLCAGDTVQLDAYMGEGVYTWTPSEGLDDPASPRPRAFPRTTTVYRVVVQAAGCSGTDSLAVVVHGIPLADAGETVSICRGDTAQLRLQTDGELVGWEPASTLDNAFTPMPRAFPAAATWYTATVRGANGCLARDSVLVEVRAPVVGIAGADTAICAGDEIVLHALGEGPFSWEPAALVDDPHAPVVRARPVMHTVFTVWSEQDGCRTRDSITVDVHNPVQASVVVPDTAVVAGSVISVPVVVRLEPFSGAPAALAMELVLEYDRRVFDAQYVTRGIILNRAINGTFEKVKVRIDGISTDSLAQGMEVTSLAGLVLFSSVGATALTAAETAFDIPGGCVAITTTPGRIHLDEYCFGSDFRFFERPRVVVAPNPASDMLTVITGAMDGQEISIAVESLWGTPLLRETMPVPETGSIALDVSSLPAGVYYLVADSRNARMVVPLCIVR